MISAGDFKNGVTVEIDGNIYQILEFQHVKPGKGDVYKRQGDCSRSECLYDGKYLCWM